MCQLQEVEGGKSVPLHPARSPPPTAPGLQIGTASEGNGGCFEGSKGSSADGNNESSVDGCKGTAANGNKGTRAQIQNSSDSPHPASATIVGNVVPTAAFATDTAKQAKRAVESESGRGEQPSGKRQKVLSAESQAAMAAIAATARLPTQVKQPSEA